MLVMCFANVKCFICEVCLILVSILLLLLFSSLLYFIIISTFPFVCACDCCIGDHFLNLLSAGNKGRGQCSDDVIAVTSADDDVRSSSAPTTWRYPTDETEA